LFLKNKNYIENCFVFFYDRFTCVVAAFFSCNCDCSNLMPEDHPATFSVVRCLSKSSYKDIMILMLKFKRHSKHNPTSSCSSYYLSGSWFPRIRGSNRPESIKPGVHDARNGSVPFRHSSIGHNQSQRPVPRGFPLFKRYEWLVSKRRPPLEISPRS